MYLINHILDEEQGCNKIIYDGCWASVKSGDNKGDWVCVNVQDMSYKRAVEVCIHETSHEIFAEQMENNPKQFYKLIEKLENETR